MCCKFVKMKRILLITENLGSGGAERQLTGLAVFLKNRGYDVKVVTYYNKQFYESYLKENNVDYELYEKAANKLTRVFYLISLFKKWNPDVIISFLPSTNLSVCLTRLFYKKAKVIVSERSHTLNFGLKVKLLFNLYRLADFIVPNSFSEAENIKKHFPGLSQKVRVIFNFVDVDYFLPLHYVKNEDIPLIVCVGRLIPSKNVLRLIDAVKDLIKYGINFRVLWVGKQYDKQYLEDVKERININKLSDIFKLKDQTENILSEYQKADIFCLPTLYEGYPNVICEAMSCGLPVVCSRVCEIPNIVKDNENGFLFDPKNVDSIVKALKKVLLLSPAQRLEMGLKNRDKIINNNSIDKFVDKYIELF